LSEVRAASATAGLDSSMSSACAPTQPSPRLADAISAALAAGLGVPALAPSDLITVVTPKLGTARLVETTIRSGIYKRVGALRLELGAKYADKHKLFEQTHTAADFKFVWVTDFPMYEWNEETKTWDAAHHPFTSPHEDDIQAGRLTNDKGASAPSPTTSSSTAPSLAPAPSASIARTCRPEIFRSLGMTDEEAHERFGFFLDALEYGTPPHGGIALGSTASS